MIEDSPKKNTVARTVTLANGIKMPSIGFGTYLTPNGEVAVQSVLTALQLGYRHIDTAAVYGNEHSVGQAVRASGLDRSDIFVVSKVWNTERGYDKTLAAFEKSLKELELEYLDLYLIHWPAAKGQPQEWQKTNQSTWTALEELYRSGRVKAIGVCNFMASHLVPLMSQASIEPMVNQIEYHPGLIYEDTVEFCKQNSIMLEAWSPLGRGKLLELPLLVKMAAKYQKSVAQLIIRWCLQNGIVPLPKSVTEARIKANLDVFDFEISNEDMLSIASIPPCGCSGHHPDTIDF